MNCKTGKTYSRKNNAFTLVELLVVISIIAILLAVMMPALSKAKEKSAQIICRTNLDQIGKCMFMYAQDNRDLFPGKETTGGWTYRAAPGWKDPTDPRGLYEKFGLAAVLGKSDYYGKSPKGAYLDGHSKAWICPVGGRTKIYINNTAYVTMAELGNSYAFSIAGMLSYTKTLDLKKRAGNNWLVWDNYLSKPYTPGLPVMGGTSNFNIPANQQVMPHKWRHKKTTSGGVNILYFDLHTELAYNQ